ncbi:hypothetical protein NHQ30_007741 [Ciborinia camelliae]|nr:hypothetical protein NHQ30_007741 [Ciborinia camelliae]
MSEGVALGIREDAVKCIDDSHKCHDGNNSPEPPSTNRVKNANEKQANRYLPRRKGTDAPALQYVIPFDTFRNLRWTQVVEMLETADSCFVRAETAQSYLKYLLILISKNRK